MRKMLVLIVVSAPAWAGWVEKCRSGESALAGQPQRKVTVYLLDRANEQYMACIPGPRAMAEQNVRRDWHLSGVG